MLTQDTIENYFHLKKRIYKAEKRIKKNEEHFKHKNYYTCTQERYEELTTVAFNVEREVIYYVDSLKAIEQHISILKYKLHHFTKFWQTLNHDERQYYLARYKYEQATINDRLDKIITEEVAEIEEAVWHHFGNDNERMIPNIISDPQENLNQMLNFLEMK